jgi:hypothetical protein
MAGPRPPLVELMLPAAARIVGDDSIKSTLEIKPKLYITVASGWIVVSKTHPLLLAVVYCGKKPERPLLLASVADPKDPAGW